MDQEFESITNVMEMISNIMKDVKEYWDRHFKSNPKSLENDKTVDKLTRDLYDILKEKYPKFYAAYSLLLFAFCRSIYNKDELLKYFDKIRRRGKIGTDSEQIDEVSSYIAKVTAIQVAANTGKRISKKEYKKHKMNLMNTMMEAREKFTEAVNAVQKNRDEMKERNEGRNEEMGEERNNEDAEEAFLLFRDTKPYETNPLFMTSVLAKMNENKE